MVRRAVTDLIGYFLWVCLHIILLIIGIFRNVKIVWIFPGRIGHLAYNTDIFLRKAVTENGDGKPIVYWGISNLPPANYQLLKMYGRQFRIIQINNKILRAILEPLSLMRSSSLFINLYYYYDSINPYFKYNHDEQFLTFTSSEEEKGKEIMANMGINDGSWFICIHARDNIYLRDLSPDFDFSYHDFRDCNIINYLGAARYIATCGGFAIRMGSQISEKMPDLGEPRIIDYASNYRSDFGDIYLGAKAKYFLANTSGIFLVSSAFGIPAAVCNHVPLWQLGAFKKGDLFIPKKVWSIEMKRFLTFRELLETKIGWYNRQEQYTKARLEVIENSDQEILDLAREMNERLDGNYKTTDEDEELQKAFHSLIPADHPCYGTPVRIGAKFLRENKDLLA